MPQRRRLLFPLGDLMLHAEIKGFDCTEVDDLTSWGPEDPNDFNINVCFHIGVVGEAGADMFYLTIVSPGALAHHGRSTNRLVLAEFNWQAVVATVQAWVDEASGHSWPQAIEGLRRRMAWEYEGMAR